MEIWPLVFHAVMTSCCNSLTFLKSMHNLLFRGSPGADFFGTTTIGLAHLDMLLVITPAHSRDSISLCFIMFQRKCVWSRTYWRAIPCIYVHFDKFCPADVFVVLGESFSILITELFKFLPNVGSNIFILQLHLVGSWHICWRVKKGSFMWNLR